MLDLKMTIEGALLRDDVKAIVVTGKIEDDLVFHADRWYYCEFNSLVSWTGLKGKFSAGFDVTSFGGMQGKKCKSDY